MAKYTYSFGGRAYPSKKAVKDRCRDLLGLTAPFSEEDSSFLADLLALHPEADEKVGCGVVRFYADGDGWGKVCFWLERLDGGKTDWSFLACLDPPTHVDEVRAAMR